MGHARGDENDSFSLMNGSVSLEFQKVHIKRREETQRPEIRRFTFISAKNVEYVLYEVWLRTSRTSLFLGPLNR